MKKVAYARIICNKTNDIMVNQTLMTSLLIEKYRRYQNNTVPAKSSPGADNLKDQWEIVDML